MYQFLYWSVAKKEIRLVKLYGQKEVHSKTLIRQQENTHSSMTVCLQRLDKMHPLWPTLAGFYPCFALIHRGDVIIICMKARGARDESRIKYTPTCPHTVITAPRYSTQINIIYTKGTTYMKNVQLHVHYSQSRSYHHGSLALILLQFTAASPINSIIIIVTKLWKATHIQHYGDAGYSVYVHIGGSGVRVYCCAAGGSDTVLSLSTSGQRVELSASYALISCKPAPCTANTTGSSFVSCVANSFVPDGRQKTHHEHRNQNHTNTTANKVPYKQRSSQELLVRVFSKLTSLCRKHPRKMYLIKQNVLPQLQIDRSGTTYQRSHKLCFFQSAPWYFYMLYHREQRTLPHSTRRLVILYRDRRTAPGLVVAVTLSWLCRDFCFRMRIVWGILNIVTGCTFFHFWL